MFFFFKDPATTEIYTYGHTLSLHDALPIYASFEDVSRSLGRGPWHTAAHAVLPQIQPALGSGAILVLGHMLAEFGALAMLRVQTFTTAIFESYELQFDSTSAAVQSAVLMALCLPAAWGEIRLRANRRVARSGRGNQIGRTACRERVGQSV